MGTPEWYLVGGHWVFGVPAQQSAPAPDGAGALGALDRVTWRGTKSGL
jgi:hypothetical protein